MGAVMKMKTLQGYLQQVKGFSEPKLELEQYETPAHIAAIALYTIQTQYDDIEGSSILDAGCGPGMLSIGSALLGAAAVTSLDIDEMSLEIFKDNVEEIEITNIDAVQCDFLHLESSRWMSYFDTVIMNPPFGTKNNSGIDMKFLRLGLNLSCNSVYSFHKSSTRNHIETKLKDWGAHGTVVAQLRYDLPQTYRFHRKHTVDIAVDLWRVTTKKSHDLVTV